MTLEDIVGLRVDGGWTPAPALQGWWVRAKATQGLQPAMTIADPQGYPTPIFAGLARRAFSGFLPIAEPIIDASGKATVNLINWVNSVS